MYGHTHAAFTAYTASRSTSDLQPASVLVRLWCGPPMFTFSKGVGADALTEFSIQCLLSLGVPWVPLPQRYV